MEVWVVRYDFERRPPQQSKQTLKTEKKLPYLLLNNYFE
jgi:hypothetical protein